MRRKRKTKYIWLPQFGTQGDSEDLDNVGFALPDFVYSNNQGQVSDVFITDIIPDEPKETAVAATDNLADFTQNEYFLKRIVGKIQYGHLTFASDPIGIPRRGIIGAGFFIARSEGGGAGVPIGASTAAERRINYGPLNQQTTREPWIWRRTWVLDLQLPAAAGPPTICDIRQFGSVADGGHIDAKTARRVRSDERIYFAMQAANADRLDTAAPAQPEGGGWVDVRLLGQMRRPQSRGVF